MVTERSKNAERLERSILCVCVSSGRRVMAQKGDSKRAGNT